jgi:hypothetical protein
MRTGVAMAQPTGGMSNTLTLKTHRDLPTITDEEFKDKGTQIFKDADNGIQTTIMSADRKTVLAVVGLNGVRYLPDPDPDPLEDLLRLALEDSRGGQI